MIGVFHDETITSFYAVRSEPPTTLSRPFSLICISSPESVGIDGNLNVGHEGETFEEAIGVSGEVRNSEQAVAGGVEAEVEGLVDREGVDGVGKVNNIDQESISKEVVTDDLTGLVDSEEDKGKEVSDAGMDGGMDLLKDGNKVDEVFSVVLEKSENNDSDDLNLEARPAYENSENGESNKVDNKSEDLKTSTLNTEHQDGESGEPKNTSSGVSKGENQKEVQPVLDMECKNEESGELKGASSNAEYVDGKYQEANDSLTSLDADHQDDNNVELRVSLGSRHGEDKGEEQGETLANLVTEHQDSQSREPEESPVRWDSWESEHHGVSASGTGRSPSVEDSAIEKSEMEQCAIEDSTIEKSETEQGVTSELAAADNISPQPERAVENVAEVKNKYVVFEEQETKEPNMEKEDQKIQGNREREIRPAEQVASSSGRSSNPGPPPAHPAGLGRAAPLLEPASRVVQQPRVNGTTSQVQAQLIEDAGNGEAEENDETREKLQMIRVKFLRLAHRLGQTPHNVVVAQVLYRLGLAEQLRGRNGGRVGAFSFDRASAMAEQLEAAGQEPLDFSCTIMVLGKTGVGKSATINSIFDEVKFSTDAFQVGTKKVQDVVGTVQGIKVGHAEQGFGDMPLLRTITEIFGPSIWFNAIVVLTHAASAPPDGPNGTASSYDMFVTQRSHVVQQAIRQAAGDMRLMNPVSLVENHSACRTNRAGQRVLPNGQIWKPHLLLLSFASKILAEANTLLKLQDSPPGKPFTTRSRSPPLPFLLSSLLQSRPQVRLPEEQVGDEDTLDEDLDDSSDSDDESEYDELPPFRRLTKAQLSKLTRAQKKAYYDELEYREKLFMKKQLKEEKERRKMMKKMAASSKDLPSDYSENAEEESGGAASVPVPMPDWALPASFDSDNPTHRYRYLDSSNQWLVRPVLETHGWDHDVGYEGINVERVFAIKDKIPVSFSGQTVGKDMAYTLRSETRFCNFRKNKATAGLSITALGDAITAGLKLEDKLIVNKRIRLVMTGGAMTGRGDVAYGGSLEATLRDKDHPLGRSLSTLGLSIMDWHGDLAIGCNIQSQIPIGRFTNMIGRVNLNNRGAGQVSIRLNSSEQLQIALIGLVPLLRKLLGYSQQGQFGQ
ncbi:Translocase of chloroplast 120, chloroplastic [Vitis vinifera]|uniref:Translocase of chloroplast 120, chloroplastic n=1 Tax=Vitis vinifera TaxID=29760 RepID=A0A438DTA2_VITVI|nr:Translocase of chloroplast 120, chloroplastic [Vitis vinifera]